MKVYDMASKLASEIKNSKEYIVFRECMNEVKKDYKSDELLKKYKSMQLDVQRMSMMGAKLDRKKQREMEEVKSLVLVNEKLKKYFEAEYKFTSMMEHINQIIANTVNQDYKF